jgi:GntR family transcriptional regulator
MPHYPFQRLQAELADLIAKSLPGTRLPSEPDLAKELGVSRATLREAMRTLENQGLLRRRQGAGTFVVGRAAVMESGLETLESPESLARRMGLTIRMSEAIIERILADEQHAAALDIPLGTRLVCISRIMQVDARPVACLMDTLPEDVLRPEELKGQFNGSALDFLLQRGDPLTVCRSAISAGGASQEIAKMLGIQPGDVVLDLTEKLYSTATKVVNYSSGYFLPQYFKFHIVRRIGGA